MSDWTFAPIIEVASGRPFNIITGNGDNLQLSSLTGRPNTTVDPACGPVYKSKYSPTGTLQEPCITRFVLTGTTPTLLQLDGNLGRNAGITPWTVFNDLRVSKRIYFGERFNMDLIADMFNIANKIQRRGGQSAVHQRRAGHRGLRSAPVPVRDEAELVESKLYDLSF